MATSMITSVSMPLQLAKELDEMYQVTMAESPSEYDKIFKVATAPAGKMHYSAQITGLGLPSQIGEGDGVPYDVPVEGNPIARTYKQYGLGYIVTDLMLKDEEHGKIKQLPASLAKSMKILFDVNGAAFMDGLDDTEISRDGSYVCGDHTLLNDVMGVGTVSNKAATGGALSETTLKAAFEYYDNVVDENGYPLVLTPDMLLVSNEDQYIAHRLMTEMYGSSVDLGGLSVNAGQPAGKNIVNPENGFFPRWKAMSSRFLNGDNWFVKANEWDGTFYWKEQPVQTSETEFDTDNIKYKAKTRFGIWSNEWRGIYGNFS